MVSNDAIAFALNLKGVTDQTGAALRPVQAWVVDEVAGQVRLRFGAETDDEAGAQRYARNGGAPYAAGTEVMVQPVGRDWFVLGPVQRGAGSSESTVEGTGALPDAPVLDLLVVVVASLRWQGTVRSMTTKQRALATRMARQFPGLWQIATGGRAGSRVRLVVQEDTWDLDSAIVAGRAGVEPFGTTGSWITDRGAQSLWGTYVGLTYDSRTLILGTGQLDSTVNEITRQDDPYSFVNVEDTWYDADRAAGRVTDQLVHGVMRQVEETLRNRGGNPVSVDGYAAAGYGIDPVRGLMSWFQQWWRAADLTGLLDDGRLPDVDDRTSRVPLTRVDIDDSWGSLQTVAAASTGGTTGAATNLDALTDVDVVDATTGQVLAKQSDGQWRGATSAGGSGQRIITVRDGPAGPSQTNPLVLEAGNGISSNPIDPDRVAWDIVYGGSGTQDAAARADHGQVAATITDLPETVQDIVAAFLIGGTGIVLTYNDADNTYTIAVNATVTQTTFFGNVYVYGYDSTGAIRWWIAPTGAAQFMDAAGVARAFLGWTGFNLYDAAGFITATLPTTAGNAARFAVAPTVGPSGSALPVAIAPLFAAQSADYTGLNATGAQKVFNVSANGAVNVAAATAYLLDAVYHIHTTGVTSHALQLAFGGTATLTSLGLEVHVTNTATEAQGADTAGWLSSAALTAVTTAVATATHHTVRIRGVVRVNAAGTLIPQYGWSAAPGVAGVTLANSYLTLTPIGANTVQTAGTWS